MAASFMIAARNNGFSKADARAATQASVTAYREAMADVRADADDGRLVCPSGRGRADGHDPQRGGGDEEGSQGAKGKKGEEGRGAGEAGQAGGEGGGADRRKAHTRDSLQALSKLCEQGDGQYRIVSQPPIIVPARALAATYGLAPEEVVPAIHEQFRAYRATLQPDRRHLLERFEIVDAARKVVGVGSVGTRAFIVLLQGRDGTDPLFLQIKEATASVLEAHLPKSRFRQHGQRVVEGQRMMQAASDIYLGWTKGLDVNRHFYWRQLRDMKGSVVVETLRPQGLTFYARTCGWTMARAHARSGDPVAIATYLGASDAFDKSITDFSQRYADQNEQDYEDVRQGDPVWTPASGGGRLRATDPRGLPQARRSSRLG